MKMLYGWALLTVVLLFLHAGRSAECRCGAPAGDSSEYLSLPADGGNPDPAVVKVSKQGRRQIIWVQYSFQVTRGSNDFEYRTVRSDDGGRTWHPDQQYRRTAFLNSERDPVVYKYRQDELLSRSLDGGVHWVDCQFIVEGLNPRRLAAKVTHNDHANLSFYLSAIQPGDPSTIYGTFVVSADPKTLQKPISLPGVYVSQDAGDHWSMFAPDLRGWDPDEPTSVLGINPSDSKQMVGHAKSGLVISSDGGSTWRPVGQHSELEKPAELKGRREAIAKRPDASSIPLRPRFTYMKVIQVEFRPGSGVIYLVTNKGLYKSEDSARTWCLVYAGTPPSIWGVHSLFLDPEDQSRLFIGTHTKVLVSEDGGCHFRVLFNWT